MSQYNQYGSSSFSTTQPPSQQLTPLSNLPTHPYQHDSPGPSQTLPPLHTHNGQNNFAPSTSYRHGSNASQTQSILHTPQSAHSTSSNDNLSLPHISSQHQMNVAEPQTSYRPVANNFSTAPPVANGIYEHHQQPRFPDPSEYTNQSLPHLGHGMFGYYDQRQNGVQQNGGMQPSDHQAQAQFFQSQAGRIDEPRAMPVVGSQGRRGILPSAAGRTPAVGSALDGSAKGGSGPHKNAENKYPCLYCNKTYLHLKHLKRHHLRRKSFLSAPLECSSDTGF